MKPLRLAVMLGLAACATDHREDPDALFARWEARDDSVEALAIGRSHQPVTRSGRTLRISHPGKAPTELIDDSVAGDASVRYRYNAYLDWRIRGEIEPDGCRLREIPGTR